MTRSEIRFYSRLDPRDPDYIDFEDEDEEEEEEEWAMDDRANDFVMTEPELRGAL